MTTIEADGRNTPISTGAPDAEPTEGVRRIRRREAAFTAAAAFGVAAVWAVMIAALRADPPRSIEAPAMDRFAARPSPDRSLEFTLDRIESVEDHVVVFIRRSDLG